MDTDETGRKKLGEYELIRHLGSGAFADVKLYKHAATGRLVAIKSVKRVAHNSGMNLGALKELAAFGEIPSHPNILSLHDAFSFAGQTHLVLEYCVTDLAAVARDRSVNLTEADVKAYALQMLDGLAAIHAARFLHADLKPDNVLVAPGGQVKLADLGHSSPVPEPGRKRFHRIVTVWYRAPELLAGARTYTTAVDMWAVGCIIAELFLRCPIFPAAGGPETRDDEWERLQMAAIQRLLGTPIDPLAERGRPGSSGRGRPGASAASGSASSAAGQASAAGHALDVPVSFSLRETGWSAANVVAAHASSGGRHAPSSSAAPRQHWPGCTSLPSYGEYEPRTPQQWRSVIPPGACSDLALDLIAKLLLYDPARRLSAAEALAHPWFQAEPPPTPPGKLPMPAKAQAAAAAAAVAMTM